MAQLAVVRLDLVESSGGRLTPALGRGRKTPTQVDVDWHVDRLTRSPPDGVAEAALVLALI